ncbi:hypothetical protein PUN71_007480 [Arthrobacter sp. NQ7]|uniref:hypothetical protein n=1 Tax=Arthrobacter sp. NQ7 TaxID=3032303 RepID=UPI00240EF8FE|nr:hypothetical protein [Arthrobacter sp. NQ7]MDJ0457035.1 hypothetical protein [Arthrobacter sp. NQ7]
MPFFLEYATDEGAGRFVVEAVDFSDALVKSKASVRGLGCINAALRLTPDPNPAFGEGSILALYRRGQGWKIQGARQA